MTGYVYAIGNDEVVKIGFSTNPRSRSSKIKTDAGHTCTLIGFVRATKENEKELHSLLASECKLREWYFRGGRLIEHFLSMLPREEVPTFKKVGTFSATALSRLFANRGVRITPQAISQWNRIPAERALDIEKLTGIPRHQLRPDLWAADDSAQ